MYNGKIIPDHISHLPQHINLSLILSQFNKYYTKYVLWKLKWLIVEGDLLIDKVKSYTKKDYQSTLISWRQLYE